MIPHTAPVADEDDDVDIQHQSGERAKTLLRPHDVPLLSCTVLGVHVAVVSGHLRHGLRLGLGLGLQQRLVLLRLLVHPAVGLPLPQALGVGGVQLLDAVAAALQPAGGRLLHHPGQPGRREWEHVQEHPGEDTGGCVGIFY